MEYEETMYSPTRLEVATVMGWPPSGRLRYYTG
jgi:hypothetical protein